MHLDGYRNIESPNSETSFPATTAASKARTSTHRAKQLAYVAKEWVSLCAASLLEATAREFKSTTIRSERAGEGGLWPWLESKSDWQGRIRNSSTHAQSQSHDQRQSVAVSICSSSGTAQDEWLLERQTSQRDAVWWSPLLDPEVQ